MVEAATPDAVIDALRVANAHRIGIDGIDGCGKTTLAREVATKLQRRLFSLDDYLERDKGRFLEFIEYSRLSAEAGAQDGFVVEGVCLLNALRRAGLTIDTLVYVKRRHRGQWADERELDVNEPLEDFLENERRLTAMVAGEPITDLGLAEEVIRYHYAERPHNKADVVYFRDEH
jgi:hypothetical protein